MTPHESALGGRDGVDDKRGSRNGDKFTEVADPALIAGVQRRAFARAISVSMAGSIRRTTMA
jgi:hypothetical protein